MSKKFQDTRQALAEIGELIHAARLAYFRASAALERALQQDAKAAMKPPSTALERPLERPCEHRRQHRFGPTPKIDRDPALQAFIRARANHMTFAAIAEEIVKHFPKDRHVSRSTLQRWWKNNRSKP
ncbi:MAG TPA: hypothetical protein ENK41_05895 [Rhodobacteraceae bacterium]|nr:hypothetical protein [Paracoccaceae bacterium]